MAWDFIYENRKHMARAALLPLMLLFLLVLNYKLFGGTYTREEYQEKQIVQSQEPCPFALTGHKSGIAPVRQWLDTGAAGLLSAVCLSAAFLCFLLALGHRRFPGVSLTLVTLFDRMDN